jgi:heptosyltransferase I
MMNSRKRILIIKLSSFGDIFHALPTVNNLKIALDAEVDWVTQPEYVDLVRCFPMVSRVIPFPRRQFLTHAGRLFRTVRDVRYDYVIDLQGLLKSALVARMARGGIRIGPSFHREGAGLLYDAVAGVRFKNRHAVDENLDVVRYLGLPILPVVFPVDIQPRAVDLPKPRVAIVPVSRRANKNWPLANFLDTAKYLQDELGASLYLFGSQSDRALCETLRADLLATPGSRTVVNLAGQTDLVEMGRWFKQMDLVIANDSGPLHMAAALGIPVVSMFGPTDPRRTGPYGGGVGVCTTDIACRPCFAKVCLYPFVECMTRISVKQVTDAVRRVLGHVT